MTSGVNRFWAFTPLRGEGFFWGPLWWLALPLLAIVAVLSVLFGSVAAYGALGLEDRLPYGGPGFLVYVLVAGFLPAALLTFLYARFVEERNFASIGLGPSGALRRFGGGAFSGLVYLVVSIGLLTALGGLSAGEVGPAFASPEQLVWIGLLLLAFIIQGGTEEVVFRGWLMSALALRGGLVFAVLCNSIIFGLLHASNTETVNWIAVGNVVLVGVLLSLMAIRDGSIWAACGWHAVWNWALATGFEIEVSGLDTPLSAFAVDMDAAPSAPDWLTGGAFGPEGSVAVTAVLGAGTIWNAVQLARRRSDDTV